MFTQIPDHRPSEAAAAWLLQVHRADADHIGRPTGMPRSKEEFLFSGQATHRGRLPKVLAWIHRIGEKLARWRLSFADYPWNRDT